MQVFDKLSELGAELFRAKRGRDLVESIDFAFSQALADQRYRYDWIARKVVDIPAFDMIREGRNWQAEDAQIEALEAEEARLQIWPKLARALKLARLYGGSALIMGTKDGNLAAELRPEVVAKDGLVYVHVASRHQINVGGVEKDPASPLWGEPTSYTMSSTKGGVANIHPSRVIPFIGAEIPDPTAANGWGDSVLQALDQAVQNANVTASGIALLVAEAKIDVFKIPKFMENVADKAYREKVIDRVRLANQAKTLTNGLLMDAEEDYIQKQVSFAQLPEVLQLYLQIAAGAADIPATRLLGQAPAGMDATGESDTRNYYDRLASEQEIHLRPRLERLDEVLIRSALGSRPPQAYFAFAPLWQLSDKEKADIFNTKATAARTLAGTGGASPPLMPIDALSDALVNTFIEDGSLPGLEAAIEEYGKLSEQEEEDPVDLAGAMPPAAKPNLKLVANNDAVDIIAWAKGRGFNAVGDDIAAQLLSVAAWVRDQIAA